MCSLHRFTDNEIAQIRHLLLSWYDKAKRDLPWRTKALDKDPNIRGYAVWVSEVMLQQTQVKTVVDYYERWMKKWPNINALAEASLEEVNSLWSGLGYYSRARLLHEGAKKIASEYDGNMPRCAELLRSIIPGVGRYTSGAISSIAFGERTPILDGNVIRVLTRIRQIGAPVQHTSTNTLLWSLAETLVDPARPGDFNQALMELGAVCCTPKQPNCTQCPLGKNALCGAYNQVSRLTSSSIAKFKIEDCSEFDQKPNVEVEECHLCVPPESYSSKLGVLNFPVKLSKKAARKQTTIVVIVYTDAVENDGSEMRFLLFQRPHKGLLAGLWEFPSLTLESSKPDDNEEPAENLQANDLKENDPILMILNQIRNCFSVSGPKLDITSSRSIGDVIHIFSHIHMTYTVWAVKLIPDQFKNQPTEWPPGLISGRWVDTVAFKDSAISTATRKIHDTFVQSLIQDYKPKIKRNRKTGRKESRNLSSIPKQLKLDTFFTQS